ncbi:MAG: N-acetylmuramic acid 6-phosphate etherase [bacterium]
MENFDVITERRNEDTIGIDTKSIPDILQIIIDEEKKVPLAVEKEIPAISRAVELVVRCLSGDGRVIYVGSGTSGRLGVIDAAECPPTYGISPDRIQAVVAGGREAVFRATERAEDDREQGELDMARMGISEEDVVVGITASGRTPYVLGALEEAKRRGAKTIGITCNERSLLSRVADVIVQTITGPEVIMGSTRMKAASAQKIVLNAISTASMIKLGKVYDNLMVDLQVTNTKLLARARRILRLATGADDTTVERVLKEANYNIKAAIVMIETHTSFDEACRLLRGAGGFIKRAISLAKTGGSSGPAPREIG